MNPGKPAAMFTTGTNTASGTPGSARGVTESGGPDRTRWLIVLLLVGAGIAVALQVGKAVSALPALSSDLGLSLVTSGWVISAVNVAGGLFGLLIGATIDRFGHRRSALCGLVVVAVCSALGAMAHDAAVMLVTRFGEGLGFMLTALAVPALLARVTALGDRGLVFGIWGAFLPAGTALAIIATPYLLSHGGWRGLWLVTAALNGLWALILAAATRTLRQPEGEVGPPLLPIMRSVATSPGPLLLAATFAAYSFQFLSVFGFLPTLFTGDYRLPVATAALLTAIAIFLNVPGNILGGWLRGRGVPRWVLICGASAIMGISAVGLYTGGLPLEWRYGCCLVLSLAGGIIPATLLGAAPDLAPSGRAVAATVGAVMQGATLGQVAGPPTVAAVATAAGGWWASAAVLGLAALIAIGLGFYLRRYEHKVT